MPNRTTIKTNNHIGFVKYNAGRNEVIIGTDNADEKLSLLYQTSIIKQDSIDMAWVAFGYAQVGLFPQAKKIFQKVHKILRKQKNISDSDYFELAILAAACKVANQTKKYFKIAKKKMKNNKRSILNDKPIEPPETSNLSDNKIHRLEKKGYAIWQKKKSNMPKDLVEYAQKLYKSGVWHQQTTLEFLSLLWKKERPLSYKKVQNHINQTPPHQRVQVIFEYWNAERGRSRWAEKLYSQMIDMLVEHEDDAETLLEMAEILDGKSYKRTVNPLYDKAIEKIKSSKDRKMLISKAEEYFCTNNIAWAVTFLETLQDITLHTNGASDLIEQKRVHLLADIHLVQDIRKQHNVNNATPVVAFKMHQIDQVSANIEGYEKLGRIQRYEMAHDLSMVEEIITQKRISTLLEMPLHEMVNKYRDFEEEYGTQYAALPNQKVRKFIKYLMIQPTSIQEPPEVFQPETNDLATLVKETQAAKRWVRPTAIVHPGR